MFDSNAVPHLTSIGSSVFHRWKDADKEISCQSERIIVQLIFGCLQELLAKSVQPSNIRPRRGHAALSNRLKPVAMTNHSVTSACANVFPSENDLCLALAAHASASRILLRHDTNAPPDKVARYLTHHIQGEDEGASVNFFCAWGPLPTRSSASSE